MTPPFSDGPTVSEIRSILAHEWDELDKGGTPGYQPDHSAAVALTALALLVCATLEGEG